MDCIAPPDKELNIEFCIINLFCTVAEGTPCETPNEEYGTCINIYNCTVLMDLLVTQSNNPRVRTYLRASTCGYLGQTPMVCCPQPKTRNVDPIILSNTTQNPQSAKETNTVITLPKKPQCGFSNVSNPRIVNGIPAKLGEFPWIVALGYKNSKNPDQPKWLCGGTLITEKHILTAGHCVYNRNDLYLARLGDLDLFSDDDGANPETILLAKAKIHENFSPVNFTNDIAILTLAETPKTATVWPICLPIDEPLRSSNFVSREPTVAGWGSLYFNGPSSPWLQEVVIPVVDNARCKRAFGTRSVIDERVLCAGYLRGGKDACQGDSGGPLMLGSSEPSNLRYHLIGVVSYGLRCAEAGYPGVYTRVTAFIDWIQRNLN
ncbi:venom protease-like [Asbolus verrucosus]|uniref:CLIP domain-containing serine protease n=1 Tax=Asbolus verrucosus TaxID=1661398 RepID=A0A482VET9_ASBVE|nr:venom protease-like [Asbolus verrucosus]